MTIRNLTAAILLGLGTISSPVLISQAQAADMETQAIAEQVKARIAQLDQINSQAYQRFLNHYPAIKNITIETSDYQPTDTGLSAVSKVTIVRDPAYLPEDDRGDIVVEIKDDIVFNDELMAQDILARINGELVLTDSLKQLLELDNQSAKEFSDALTYLDITTDLRPNGEVGQMAQIKAFDHDEDGEKIHFDGLTLDSQYNESNAIDGVGKFQLQVGQLIITDNSGNDQGEATSNTLTLYPFNIDYTLQENGKLRVTGSPFKLTNSEDNTEITADGLQGTGSDVHFDDAIGTFIGEQEFLVNNIQIHDDTMPAPIVLDSIRFTSDAEKDGDLYDFEGAFNIDVNGESINQVSGMTGLEIEDINFKVSFDDISANTFKLFNYQLPAIAEQGDQSKINNAVQALLSDMAENESDLQIETAFNTDQGDATFVANIKAKSDAVIDAKQWQVAMDSPQPTEMLQLIQQSFDFDIKLIIPESLLKATGTEPMIGMAAGYIVKDGSDYTLHIENTSDGIKLNGNVMPLPQ